MLRNILKLCGDIIKSTWVIIKRFMKKTIKDAPAAGILIFATIGVSAVLTNTPVMAVFMNVWFINEVYIVSVLSIIGVMLMATIAGRIQDIQIHQ